MHVDLLVLLEPRVHLVPFETNRVGELGKRRLGVPQRGILRGAVANLQMVDGGVPAARRVVDRAGGDQQIRSYISGGEIVSRGGAPPDEFYPARIGGVLPP